MKYLAKGILLSLLLGASVRIANAQVKVFAAASLTDALQAIAKDYEAAGGDKVVFNFAGSNVLARQIEQGAPADIFISADEAEMDAVARAGLMASGTRRDLLSNTLVVILAKDNTVRVDDAKDLLKPELRRVAIGDPAVVPAGVYAKAYLERKGIWSPFRSKVVPTENVRATLAAVASGNADAGIVYKTDAQISNKVRIAYEVPASSAPPILYPIALLGDAAKSEAARKFLSYIESPKGAAIFARYGFISAGSRR